MVDSIYVDKDLQKTVIYAILKKVIYANLKKVKEIKNANDQRGLETEKWITTSLITSVSVRYTRGDLPLHPPIRRIFSLKSK